MAKSKVVDVSTVAASGVTVKRWWQSFEVWNGIANAVLSVVAVILATAAVAAPVVLAYIDQLGLSPFGTMMIVIAAKVIIEVNQIVLKMRTTSIIGNKTDVQIAREAVDEPSETGVR